MTDPIDLNARRDERVPEPEGEPAITMPMDSDQIIFRDQAALDDYVAGATDALRAELDNLRGSAKAVGCLHCGATTGEMLPHEDAQDCEIDRRAALVRGSDDEAGEDE